MTDTATAVPGETGPTARGLADFHPAVRTWFERRFPEGPTEPQAQGWPLIAAGFDALIAAPTGSGKTLAGFLVAIDALYRAHDGGEPISDVARVVYVSPLKALAVDIAENLERPLREIADVAAELGLASPDIRVAVRTGDTTSSQRSLMARRPPSFVVTTPESLYLLVTSARGREALRTVETVIVDEIHAVARDKRGAHLALSLERLESLCDRRPARIGLSATQRPIETVGRLLVGERPLPAVVDVGHQRDLDLALELGIDIGPVELVCQIGSPRSIATFLQRVGRSNHSRGGTPKGRLFPLTRDELVECAALMAAVRAGRLDVIRLARLPLDIAAQQIVAEVAAKEWR